MTASARAMAERVVALLASAPRGLNQLTEDTGASGDRDKIAALTSAIGALRRAGVIELHDSKFVLAGERPG